MKGEHRESKATNWTPEKSKDVKQMGRIREEEAGMWGVYVLVTYS